MIEPGWYEFLTNEPDGPTTWSGEVIEVNSPLIRVVALNGEEQIYNVNTALIRARRLDGRPDISFRIEGVEFPTRPQDA